MTLMGRKFFILLRTVFDLLWLVLGCGKLWIADGIWNAMPNCKTVSVTQVIFKFQVGTALTGVRDKSCVGSSVIGTQCKY